MSGLGAPEILVAIGLLVIVSTKSLHQEPRQNLLAGAATSGAASRKVPRCEPGAGGALKL